VSVLIPRLLHRRRWHRLLHDSTAEHLASSLSKLSHVNVTFVPFHLGRDDVADSLPADLVVATDRTDGDTIGSLAWRQPATASGKVIELALETVKGTPSVVATITDGTGRLDLLFLGRAAVGGIRLGASLTASGMAAAHRGRLTIINPVVELHSAGHEPGAPIHVS
jgi:hypothetical protein